jgi:hypothetical protein
MPVQLARLLPLLLLAPAVYDEGDNHMTSKITTKRLAGPLIGMSMLALTVTGCGTATGAAVGAGSGAAIGAGTGYGAGKGALIGVGVGAAAGAIYDITKH